MIESTKLGASTRFCGEPGYIHHTDAGASDIKYLNHASHVLCYIEPDTSNLTGNDLLAEAKIYY